MASHRFDLVQSPRGIGVVAVDKEELLQRTEIVVRSDTATRLRHPHSTLPEWSGHRPHQAAPAPTTSSSTAQKKQWEKRERAFYLAFGQSRDGRFESSSKHVSGTSSHCQYIANESRESHFADHFHALIDYKQPIDVAPGQFGHCSFQRVVRTDDAARNVRPRLASIAQR